MRWKQPNEGDEKIKKKFALFPITIGKETRWLEWVNIKYTYYETFYFFYMYYGWEKVEFIDEEIEVATNV